MASSVDATGWHEWLCHSNFSFLIGASHPAELLWRPAALRYEGLALTDFDGVYGLARAYVAWKKLKALKPEAPLRLFCGGELRLAREHERPVILQDTVALIALNFQGYAHLCQIMTLAHRHGKTGAHLPLEDLLAADVEGLVAIQPMRGLMAQKGQDQALANKCRLLAEHFGERFYMAVSRQLHPAEDHMVPAAIALARQLGIECLLTQDAFFHEPEQ